MDTLYTFWDNITHYRTESVHFWGLMNSATKVSKVMIGVISGVILIITLLTKSHEPLSSLLRNWCFIMVLRV